MNSPFKSQHCWGICLITMLVVLLMYLLKLLHAYSLLLFHVMPDDSSSGSRDKNLRISTKVESKAEGRKSRGKGEVNSQNQCPKSNKVITEVLSMDCEMVGVRKGNESILARVSIVNSDGYCLYDTFVIPTENVVDYRTRVSGVRPEDLTKGVSFSEAQHAVLRLLKDRILVGHDLRHDFKVLNIKHPRGKIRDTSLYPPFRALVQGSTPSLKHLTRIILGKKIQQGEHSSIQDARIAMRLYNAHKNDWESLGNNM